MINYQSGYPSTKFLMLEDEAINELGSDPLYLYIKLRKLGPNESNSKEHLMKISNFKEWKFKRAKAELLDKGYLDIKQLYGNKYAFYIGKESVSRYQSKFKKSYNRRENNQLGKMEPL